MSHDDFARWDNEFHGNIYLATRNEFLISLHRILSVVRFRPAITELRKRSSSEENGKTYSEQHQQIIAAASSAMREHLIAINRNLFGEGTY